MRRSLAVALFFAVLAVAMTWPLAINLDRFTADPEDPYLNTFILHWDYAATVSDPLSLFHAPMFHPARYALAFSENMYGIALPLFPLFAAGLPPLAVYNIAIILGFALSGWAAWLLALRVTGSTAGAFVAGIFYAFLPYRFVQLTHLQHVWSMWLPLMLLALFEYRRRPGWRSAALFGAAFLMNGLSNIHWLVFGSFAIAATAVLLIALSDDRKAWLPLAASTAFAAIMLLPFLIPYAKASELYGMKRIAGDVKAYSATLSDWFMVGGRSYLYESFRGAHRENHELNLGFGIVALLLCAAALLLAKRRGEQPAMPDPPPRAATATLRLLDLLAIFCAVLSYLALSAGRLDLGIVRMSDPSVPMMLGVVLLILRLWLSSSIRSFLARSRFSAEQWCCFLWIAIGVVGSLGMNAFLHQFLYDRIPVFAAIRVPARWGMVAYTGLTIPIAIGVQSLIDRVRWRRTAFAGIAAVLMLEFFTPPLRWWSAAGETPAMYRWLAGAGVSGAMLEIPTSLGSDEYHYLLRATEHGVPLVNGVSGFFPKDYSEIERLLSGQPIGDALLERLEQYGCSTIVVHADRLFDRSPAVRDWLRLELRRGRLVFLRRFDHGVEGDYVFAVAEREPKIASLRSSRDDAALAAFIDQSGRTRNASPFGALQEPRHGSWVSGPLTVSGWALAPHGIREVNLLFGNGRLRVPAELRPWPQLTRELFPWYPGVPKPAFSKTFEEPLRGLRRDTDLQVEIVDGRGRRVLLDDVWFTWTGPDTKTRRWKPARRTIHPSSWRARELQALILSLGLDPGVESNAILDGRASIDELVRVWAQRYTGRPDSEFVDACYAILLLRGPDAIGRDFYLRQLRGGASRDDVIDAMLSSDEFSIAQGLR